MLMLVAHSHVGKWLWYIIHTMRDFLSPWWENLVGEGWIGSRTEFFIGSRDSFSGQLLYEQVVPKAHFLVKLKNSSS